MQTKTTQVSPSGMAAASQAVRGEGGVARLQSAQICRGFPLAGNGNLSSHESRSKLHMQVSPSGMAAASQAVPGEFDSRHLLHLKSTLWGCFFRCAAPLVFRPSVAGGVRFTPPLVAARAGFCARFSRPYQALPTLGFTGSSSCFKKRVNERTSRRLLFFLRYADFVGVLFSLREGEIIPPPRIAAWTFRRAYKNKARARWYRRPPVP